VFSSFSIFLTFIIITINRNSTAIAPTYNIIKIIPKKSRFSIKNKIDTFKKISIKKSIEFIGLVENTIKKEEHIKIK